MLLITVSWLGGVSLQQIPYEPTQNTAEQFDRSTQVSPQQYSPLPYRSVFLPSPQPLDSFEKDQLNDFYEHQEPNYARKRRTIGNFDKETDDWLANQIDDSERSSYYSDRSTPYRDGKNASDLIVVDVEKRNFSPWGGKRGEPIFDPKWYWNRAENIKEPSMPKRVRFSPWGGKRSGHFIYKSGGKVVPEFTSAMQAVLPNGERLNIAGIQLLDKRHPIKVLTLSTDAGLLRKAMPFKNILEQLPRFFKIGHPYSDVNLKKDGKRKVKFSAWGGKRSPPIIGPIWTPAPSDVKESTLNAILLIRNNLHRFDKIPV